MAMYPFSRPWPWDSQISSPAVNRTSTGNDTFVGSRSMIRRSAANASGSADRGKPYSISTNLTRRGDVKTRSERSV